MPIKKAVTKKPPVRRKATRARRMEVVGDPVPEPMPEPMPGPGTSKARVVYFAGCRNCNHLPMGVNALLSVMVAIIFTLSAMLMATSVASTTVVDAAAVATR